MVVNVNKKRKARYVIMNLKKKIAMAMAVAAVCCSIGTPAVANAGEARLLDPEDCIHNWRIDKDTEIYTMHHGYSVGDDEYKDCVITTTTVITMKFCPYCESEEVIEETTISHSACGL